MSIDPRTVTEDELQAYVDGRLDPSRVPHIEAYLRENAAEATRVEAYRRQNAVLRAMLLAPETAPISERLTDAARGARRRRDRGWIAQAAAAVILVAVGLGGGWLLRGAQAPGDDVLAEPSSDLARQAAAAHRVYTVERRHPVEVRAEEAHLIRWLSKRLDAPLTAPDLLPFGYRLVGGRLLPADEGAAAQLMYEDQGGHRITVYLRSNRTGTETAFRFVEQDGLSAFYWVEGPLGYAIVGPLRRDDLMGLARAVYESAR